MSEKQAGRVSTKRLEEIISCGDFWSGSPEAQPMACELLKLRAASTPEAADRGDDRWVDIETAPRDGTHILAVDCVGYSRLPVIVHWFDDPNEPGFYPSGYPGSADPDYPLIVTHWRPLPPGASGEQAAVPETKD